MHPMEITTSAFVALDKEVKSCGNSGCVYLPTEWRGKRVKILLLEKLDE